MGHVVFDMAAVWRRGARGVLLLLVLRRLLLHLGGHTHFGDFVGKSVYEEDQTKAGDDYEVEALYT